MIVMLFVSGQITETTANVVTSQQSEGLSLHGRIHLECRISMASPLVLASLPSPFVLAAVTTLLVAPLSRSAFTGSSRPSTKDPSGRSAGPGCSRSTNRSVHASVYGLSTRPKRAKESGGRRTSSTQKVPVGVGAVGWAAWLDLVVVGGGWYPVVGVYQIVGP